MELFHHPLWQYSKTKKVTPQKTRSRISSKLARNVLTNSGHASQVLNLKSDDSLVVSSFSGFSIHSSQICIALIGQAGASPLIWTQWSPVSIFVYISITTHYMQMKSWLSDIWLLGKTGKEGSKWSELDL